jgi:hypothetical protein
VERVTSGREGDGRLAGRVAAEHGLRAVVRGPALPEAAFRMSECELLGQPPGALTRGDRSSMMALAGERSSADV